MKMPVNKSKLIARHNNTLGVALILPRRVVTQGPGPLNSWANMNVHPSRSPNGGTGALPKLQSKE